MIDTTIKINNQKIQKSQETKNIKQEIKNVKREWNKTQKQLRSAVCETIKEIQEIKRVFERKGEEFWKSHIKNFKKYGHWYLGLCPFHDDKNPSLGVKVTNSFYFKCFGCGEKGDAIHFLQKRYDISREEAVKKLLEELDLDVQIAIQEVQEKRDIVSEIAEQSEKHLKEIEKEIDWKEYENVDVYSYYDFSGKYLYSKFRFYNENGDKAFMFLDKKKEQKTILFGLNFFDANKKYLALCEGEKDTKTLQNINSFFKKYNIFGYNAFSTEFENTLELRGSIKFLRWMREECESIVLFEDNDERGYSNTTDIIHKLKSFGKYHFTCVQFHQNGKGFDISDFLNSKLDEEKGVIIEELVLTSPNIIVLTAEKFRENRDELCKYQRNVIIANKMSIFSKFFDRNMKNIVIFDDDILNFEVEEIEKIFEDANVYIDKYVYRSLRKFPFLKFSFLSQKTFLINEIGVEEIFDKEKKVTEIDLHERYNATVNLLKQLKEAKEEAEKKRILEELNKKKALKLFDEKMQIPEGSVSVITGLGESGKTTFVCLYSVYLAVKKGYNVAIVTLEESREHITRRIDNALIPVFLSDLTEHEKVREKIDVFSSTSHEIKFLVDFCLRNHDVVFVDNLSYLLTDENRNEEVSRFLTYFVQLALNTKKNIVFLHHANKEFISDYVYNAKNLEELKLLAKKNAIRGASAILNSVRNVFLVMKDANGDCFIITIKKNLTKDVCYRIEKFQLCYENYVEKLERYVDGYYERCDVDDFLVEAEPVLHSEVRGKKKEKEEVPI